MNVFSMEVVNLSFWLKGPPEPRSQGAKINNKSLIAYANNMSSGQSQLPSGVAQ